MMKLSKFIKSNLKNISTFLLATLAIFIFFVGVFETILYRLGETLPYGVVIQQQTNDDVFFFPRYSNVSNQYKIQGIKHYHPKIVALGTSRIMQMNNSHLHDRNFYNAGVDASTSRDLDGIFEIVRSLKDDELPQTIIVGIDPWVFNPNYPLNQKTLKNKVLKVFYRTPFLKNIYGMYRFTKDRIYIYDKLVREKENWIPYLDKKQKGIGLNAKLLSAGYAVDGSFHYPENVKEHNLLTAGEWMEILREDQYRFAKAEGIDTDVLNQFKKFLQYCQEKNIRVIGLLLPFRNDFYLALSQMESHAVYFRMFRRAMPLVMNDFGYHCFDYSEPTSLGLTVNDFIDNYHMQEKAFEKIGINIPADHLIQEPIRI